MRKTALILFTLASTLHAFAADTTEAKGSSTLGDNAYWVFISFLYAWIAAEIANRFAKVVSEHKPNKPKWWPALVRSHLTLAAVVVGTSWLAWSQAFAKGHVQAPEEVISLQSLLLIVDFVILVMYFTFVAVVGDERTSVSIPHPQEPYWRHSSYWIFLILATYVCWDILAYSIIPIFAEHPEKTHFWAHSWATIACAAIAFLAFLWLKRERLDRHGSVVAGDVSLIAMIFLFRTLKRLSHADPLPSAAEQLRALIFHFNGYNLIALLNFLVFTGFGWFAGLSGHHLPLTGKAMTAKTGDS